MKIMLVQSLRQATSGKKQCGSYDTYESMMKRYERY